MIKSNIKVNFISNIKDIWNVVTNNEDYTWRSDLSKIEVIENSNQFIEYTIDNFPTIFTITKKEEYKVYEFDFTNKNIKGRWIGIFKKTENGTEIDFTEQVQTNNPIMILFGKMYLKKQQAKYINDLKNKLNEI